jgi:hypothetical protein
MTGGGGGVCLNCDYHDYDDAGGDCCDDSDCFCPAHGHDVESGAVHYLKLSVVICHVLTCAYLTLARRQSSGVQMSKCPSCPSLHYRLSSQQLPHI